MKAVAHVKQEPLSPLRDVEGGKVVRFPSTTYEDALTGHGECSFFIVVKPKNVPLKAGRAKVVSFDGALEKELDDVTLVHVHDSETAVYAIPPR